MVQVQAVMERRVAQLRGSEAWTERDGRLVLEALAGSGETLAGFARRMKLVPQRLYWWRKRLGLAARGPSESALATFVPMVVQTVAPRQVGLDGGAVICFGAIRVELSELSPASAAWAATVVRSLLETAP